MRCFASPLFSESTAPKGALYCLALVASDGIEGALHRTEEAQQPYKRLNAMPLASTAR